MTSQPILLPLADGERHEQRDDIGRLIGLMFRHGAASAAGTPRVLVAVDGTEVSDALMEQLIEWQQRFHWNFDIHLLTVRDSSSAPTSKEEPTPITPRKVLISLTMALS